MSEIKHSFRIMIIDIEKDKVVVDEFADAIVGGIAKNVMPGEDGACAEIAVTRATTIGIMNAVTAAESIVKKQKRMLVMDFLKNATPEEKKECFGMEDVDKLTDILEKVMEDEDESDS